ncbi:MAG: hypothetical protein IIB15_02070 [Chloroflexi bacterium]|nr:hypothetical protein [Chloroflexota bacterium]MCH8108892.1 hypothetical protein [Chloroflexota bacterium]
MIVYWQSTRKGQRLILSDDDNEINEEVGGVRETKRGFDAFAKTFGYEPGRAQKGIPTMEEAKEFVELLKPWELFSGGDGLAVDPLVRSAPE